MLELMTHTMSTDVMALSMRGALRRCVEAGMPEAEAKTYLALLHTTWKQRASDNPLSCLF